MPDKVQRSELWAMFYSEQSDPKALTLSKGKFTMRKGFFFRHGKTPEASFARTLQTLQEHFNISEVEYGSVDKPFKGGADVKANSHFWMTFKADRKAA